MPAFKDHQARFRHGDAFGAGYQLAGLGARGLREGRGFELTGQQFVHRPSLATECTWGKEVAPELSTGNAIRDCQIRQDFSVIFFKYDRGSVKSTAQLRESIERFRRGFWERQRLDRPPVGIVNDRIFRPIEYLRRELDGDKLEPAQMDSELCRTDYECASAGRKVFCDDWMPFNAAWRAIPWLEAICGCPVRCASGSLAAAPLADSSAAVRTLPVPADTRWQDLLRQQTEQLLATCPSDCWISPTIMRGPSDIIAAMRGLTEFYMDLCTDPGAMAALAARVNQLWMKVAELHFSRVTPKLGGYGHIYGYWSPEKTTVIQEDALGMCSPGIYREIFMEHNARLVRHLGAHVLFHLHTTGYGHYRDVLSIPGLAGLEITVEANGPRLAELLPVLQEVLERSRLLLYVEADFEHLPGVLQHLPREGLYLLIPERYIGSDEEFQDFVARVWPARS